MLSTRVREMIDKYFTQSLRVEAFVPSLQKPGRARGSVQRVTPLMPVPGKEAITDWFQMYEPRDPWLIVGRTEVEFDRMLMRDRLAFLLPCIAKTIVALGYDDHNITKYYLDVVCGILPRANNEGGPDASTMLQVRRALVYVNHPDVLKSQIGEIDVAQAKLEAAGGLPSFQQTQTVASLEELISDTPRSMQPGALKIIPECCGQGVMISSWSSQVGAQNHNDLRLKSSPSTTKLCPVGGLISV